MATDNRTIIQDIWLHGNNDYQQRIPNPTQSQISATVDALFEPMNMNYYNMFMDSLIMRIGSTYVKQQSFKNPLREFKRAQVTYGSTIQEMIPKWIRAHSYRDDAEDVFKMHRPEAVAWYHSQNRQDMYPITINETELRTAFTSEYGLNELVASVMATPINSDNYDEFCIMKNLIAIFNQKWGFFKHALSAYPNDEQTGKEFLQTVKEYAGYLAFPSTTYNNSAIPDIPLFVKPQELILLVTPKTQAAIDVQTLASVFQLDKAELQYRTVPIDQFPIEDDECVALLTTKDFFMCADTLYRNTSQYNPKTLGNNFYLHHWGIYSVSPFVPAIMFTVGGQSTTLNRVTVSVTGMTLTPATQNVEAGDTLDLTITLQGSVSPETKGIELAPAAAIWDVSVTRDGDAVRSPRTRVDQYGVLHVDEKLQAGDVITVTANSTYINPSGMFQPLSAEATFTVA